MSNLCRISYYSISRHYNHFGKDILRRSTSCIPERTRTRPSTRRCATSRLFGRACVAPRAQWGASRPPSRPGVGPDAGSGAERTRGRQKKKKGGTSSAPPLIPPLICVDDWHRSGRSRAPGARPRFAASRPAALLVPPCRGGGGRGGGDGLLRRSRRRAFDPPTGSFMAQPMSTASLMTQRLPYHHPTPLPKCLRRQLAHTKPQDKTV